MSPHSYCLSGQSPDFCLRAAVPLCLRVSSCCWSSASYQCSRLVVLRYYCLWEQTSNSENIKNSSSLTLGGIALRHVVYIDSQSFPEKIKIQSSTVPVALQCILDWCSTFPCLVSHFSCTHLGFWGNPK